MWRNTSYASGELDARIAGRTSRRTRRPRACRSRLHQPDIRVGADAAGRLLDAVAQGQPVNRLANWNVNRKLSWMIVLADPVVRIDGRIERQRDVGIVAARALLELDQVELVRPRVQLDGHVVAREPGEHVVLAAQPDVGLQAEHRAEEALRVVGDLLDVVGDRRIVDQPAERARVVIDLLRDRLGVADHAVELVELARAACRRSDSARSSRSRPDPWPPPRPRRGSPGSCRSADPRRW